MPDIKSPYQVLKEFEQEFIHAIQQSIDNNDRHARGGLWQSVKAQTKIYGQMVVMEIKMDQYWKFVDKGVNGNSRAQGSEYTFKKKNIKTDAMLDFIRNRGITKFKRPNGDVIFDVNMTNKQRKSLKGLKSKKIKKAYKASTMDTRRKTLAFLLGKIGRAHV